MTTDWNTFIAAQGLAADGTTFGKLSEELDVAQHAGVIAPLVDFGLIRASGPDAAGYLHNLLTNDVNGITGHNARFAGFCTAKGRVLATLLIWREDDDLLLMLPRDLHAAVFKKLSMYVLRSKVKVTDATAERALFGISSAVPPAPTLGDLPAFGAADSHSGRLIRLDVKRWILALPLDTAAGAWTELAQELKPVGTDTWRWLEINAAQPRVVAATQEAFIPQMLNMELPAVAGVSFTKGCYPGQEIVARTQYLGKVKRRMYRARLAASAEAGTHLYAPATGEQHCGAVVTTAPSPAGGIEALVCVQAGAVEGGEVHVGTSAGPLLQFLDLPYPLGD
jgi:folate-binding protein YgfZ